jgi:hypothetical protein
MPIESSIFLKKFNMRIIQNAELDADLKKLHKVYPKKAIG